MNEEVSGITEALRRDVSDVRERLASLESHVRIAHVREIEEIGNRITRLSGSLAVVRNIQWAVVVSILANLAAIIFKSKGDL